jgi:hypothetical protein
MRHSLTWQYWRFLAAVAIGTWLGLWFAYGASAQPVVSPVPMEASWGYAVPDVTGTRGRCDHVLARGALSASEHEADEGIASVGLFTIIPGDAALDFIVPPTGAAATIARQCVGRRVELVIREVPPLERLKRK